jgi:uncharacterized membrane protein YqiK
MTRYRFALICLAVIAITTAGVLRTAAQVAAPPAAGAAPTVQAIDPNAAAGVRFAPVRVDGLTTFVEVPVDRGELHKSQEQAAAALKAYGDAETDEQKAAAEKELQDAVSEQFEVLMKSREAQIAELKSRLDKLTEQLQKRRDAKEQIVKLRVQVLVNEAQGLGFYPEGTAAWPAMGYGVGAFPTPVGVPAYPATAPPPVSR